MESIAELDFDRYLQNIPRGYTTYILGVVLVYLLYRVSALMMESVTSGPYADDYFCSVVVNCNGYSAYKGNPRDSRSVTCLRAPSKSWRRSCNMVREEMERVGGPTFMADIKIVIHTDIYLQVRLVCLPDPPRKHSCSGCELFR